METREPRMSSIETQAEILALFQDVLNVSGHRLSTAEIESALVQHAAVAETAVVGAPDETTGQTVL